MSTPETIKLNVAENKQTKDRFVSVTFDFNVSNLFRKTNVPPLDHDAFDALTKQHPEIATDIADFYVAYNSLGAMLVSRDENASGLSSSFDTERAKELAVTIKEILSHYGINSSSDFEYQEMLQRFREHGIILNSN